MGNTPGANLSCHFKIFHKKFLINHGQQNSFTLLSGLWKCGEDRESRRTVNPFPSGELVQIHPLPPNLYDRPMIPNELLDTEYLVPPLEEHAPAPMLNLGTREKIHAAAMTACTLLALGDDEIDETEIKDGRDLARAIFQDAREPTEEELKKPAVVLHLEALLSEYDHEIIQDATSVRRYVTHRLLEESAPDKDPKYTLRALENLGKITEVGLFTERVEVTVKQQSTEELQDQLQEALRIINAKTIDGESTRVQPND